MSARAAILRQVSQTQEFREAPRLLGSLVPATVGYAGRGLEQRIHRGLPSPYLTFIFSLDGPVVTGETAAEALGPHALRHEVLVGGLATRPAYVVQPPNQAGVQLAVHPLAARAVFGLPAAELGLLAVDGRDVLGGAATEVHDQLRSADSWAARFRLLQAFLRRRVEQACAAAPRAEIVEAWTWMARFRGRGSMDGVSRHVHLSGRQLRTLFGREIGLSPKQVSRLLRFDHAKQLIAGAVARQRPLDLTSVAVQTGFYDHAHLDREFVALAGTSPTGWLAEERRNIQAGGHGTAEDFQP